MKRYLWIVVLLAFLSACSGRPGEITGRVMDETGQPVADAVVRVQTTTISTITDETGQFTLTK